MVTVEMRRDTEQRPISDMELLAITKFIEGFFYSDAHPRNVVQEFVDTLEARGFEIVTKANTAEEETKNGS